MTLPKKITELPTATPAGADVLPFVDVSAGPTTSKATLAALVAAALPGIASDGTTFTTTTPAVANGASAKVTPKTIPVDVQTTNATPTPIQVFSVGTTSGVVVIRGIVTASDATATNVGCWAVDLVYKNVGGTLTQLGTGGITPYGTPSGTLALAVSVSAGAVTLTGTGIAATNLRWTSNGFQNVAVGT